MIIGCIIGLNVFKFYFLMINILLLNFRKNGYKISELIVFMYSFF